MIQQELGRFVKLESLGDVIVELYGEGFVF